MFLFIILVIVQIRNQQWVKNTISLRGDGLQDIGTPLYVFKPTLLTDRITVDPWLYRWNNEVFGKFILNFILF